MTRDWSSVQHIRRVEARHSSPVEVCGRVKHNSAQTRLEVAHEQVDDCTNTHAQRHLATERDDDLLNPIYSDATQLNWTSSWAESCRYEWDFSLRFVFYTVTQKLPGAEF